MPSFDEERGVARRMGCDLVGKAIYSTCQRCTIPCELRKEGEGLQHALPADTSS